MKDFFAQFSSPLVFDGAMGTMLEGFPGVNEKLNLINPGVIADVHRKYKDAGADVIITNTFGASRIALAEHGLADKVGDINRAAVRIARSVGSRFVAGELGPTSKLPSLGHISFDELESAYIEQTAVLIEEGVDLIIISTSQDPLQVKAAASAARQAMESLSRKIPLIVSVTVENNGTMLVGTTLAAALASVEPFQPSAFGINCALGPDLMEEYLAELARISPFPIICQPNAGLPENRDGKAVYPLMPEEFAQVMGDYAQRFGLSAVGGCCGTTPDHIAALTDAVRDVGVSRERPAFSAHCASLFGAISLDQEPKPLIVAEQTNANGSKKFREMVAARDWDGCVAHARRAAEGAHVLDVAVALPGDNELKAMRELVHRLNQTVDRPLMIDSTNIDAIDAALSQIGGRAIINSINLEDGGAKATRIISSAVRFGAAVVCLTIDEDGMATTAERKLAIAKRLVELAKDGGLRERDLIIDPLVFTLASGDKASAGAGRETLEAIVKIKEELPGVWVSLGVSNVSFGLMPKGRRALTSYFLHRAVEVGVDAAIVNARTIMPVDRIDVNVLPWIERLVDNDVSEGDPLTTLLEMLTEQPAEVRDVQRAMAKRSPTDLLRSKVIEGERAELSEVIEEVLRSTEPRDVVNDVLMPAMKLVGERFGGGTMPLPFVLQSAETMRAAIDILSPHLKSEDAQSRGTIVLATVRGDVHDIGKNLVDAILSNNGFKVINLGIRQSAANVIEAVKEHDADAIGLSGLLVSSTEIMREDLEVFKSNELSIPVLCGGAALTEKFTREVLVPAYGADVCYCADAFDGLNAMEEIISRQ